jgi:hypothetical protein
MGFLSKMKSSPSKGFGNAMEEAMESAPSKKAAGSKGKKKRALAPRFDLMSKA